MAILKHEVWLDAEGLPMCCLAGPMGDDARRLQGEGARLVWTFEAGSHLEAMTKYNEFLGRGPCTPSHEWDLQSYPEEWAVTQRG